MLLNCGASATEKLFNRFVAPPQFDIDQQCKPHILRIGKKKQQNQILNRIRKQMLTKTHRVPFQMHMIMSFVVVAAKNHRINKPTESHE